MSTTDLSWSVPVMRAGYAGRGVVYLAVAGLSLYALWWGGQTKGTTSAMAELENSTWGSVVLFVICIGLLAYAVWRFVAAFYDLECRGSDAKGLGARAGMIISGIVNLALGGLAFSLLFLNQEGGGSTTGMIVSTVMAWPGGRWIVGAFGVVVIGVGAYYGHKGWSEKYRQDLQANHVTTHWNNALKAGLIAQGVVIAIVGMLFVQAAWHANPSEAGGTDDAFSWLIQQPHGWALMSVICLGLLGFALFCFVNSAYRIVPRVVGDDVETLAARLEAKARDVANG